MIPVSYAALSNRYNKQARHYVPAGINYAILVPTLRCNLSCSYCQVSRANQDAKGYDWTNQNLKAAINFIAEKATPGIKIEFQGGEPTLRLDLLRSIIDELNDRLIQPSFVICSNLQEVGDELLDLITLKNVQISCSLDGPQIIHQQNRTVDNLRLLISFIGTSGLYERTLETIKSLWFLPSLTIQRFHRLSTFTLKKKYQNYSCAQ